MIYFCADCTIKSGCVMIRSLCRVYVDLSCNDMYPLKEMQTVIAERGYLLKVHCKDMDYVKCRFDMQYRGGVDEHIKPIIRITLLYYRRNLEDQSVQNDFER